MAELIKVRGLTRSGGGVRVNKKMIKSTKTVVLDLDDAVTRRDLARHMAIGALVVVGDAATAIKSGLVVSAGTGLSYSVTAGTLLRESGNQLDVAAVTNSALTAADVTNPRIDLVHVNNESGAIAKTDGTPAATPFPPATPVGVTALAHVRVNAGATAPTSITDVGLRL